MYLRTAPAGVEANPDSDRGAEPAATERRRPPVRRCTAARETGSASPTATSCGSVTVPRPGLRVRSVPFDHHASQPSLAAGGEPSGRPARCAEPRPPATEVALVRQEAGSRPPGPCADAGAPPPRLRGAARGARLPGGPSPHLTPRSRSCTATPAGASTQVTGRTSTRWPAPPPRAGPRRPDRDGRRRAAQRVGALDLNRPGPRWTGPVSCAPSRAQASALAFSDGNSAWSRRRVEQLLGVGELGPAGLPDLPRPPGCTSAWAASCWWAAVHPAHGHAPAARRSGTSRRRATAPRPAGAPSRLGLAAQRGTAGHVKRHRTHTVSSAIQLKGERLHRSTCRSRSKLSPSSSFSGLTSSMWVSGTRQASSRQGVAEATLREASRPVGVAGCGSRQEVRTRVAGRATVRPREAARSADRPAIASPGGRSGAG